MLPHNNYLSCQTLPNPNQYTFDLKVNVDLNSGKVGLGVPTNVQPAPSFSRTSQIPVIYPPPAQHIPYSPPNSFSAPSPALFSSYPPVPAYPPGEPVRQNQHIYTSTHTGYPGERSQIRHYSPNLKARSAYDTYPDSSFSLNMERSLDAVNCVICNKPVSREQFPIHLEQHKGRKKQYTRVEPKPRNQMAKQSSFMMNNQSQMDAVKDMYKPSVRNSLSLDPRDSRMYARSNKVDISKNSFSRQIQESHSRIVYAPRDPSKIVSSSSSSNNSHGNSDFNYSKSSGLAPNRSNQSNQSNRVQLSSVQSSNRGQPSYQQQTISQPSFNQSSVSQLNFKQPSPQPNLSAQNLSKQGFSRMSSQNMEKSKKSSHLLPSEVSKKMQDERMRASKMESSKVSNPDWGYQSRKTSNFNLSRSKHNNSRYSSSTSGFYDRNQTKSRLIRPQKTRMLQDCDQSMIHHLKDLSRFSRDSHLGQLNKQLKIQKIEEESSSDQQYSIKPNPSVRMWASISPTRTNRMEESMSMSLGLNRTKLPRNYLAMQQFIQNPMYYSCYRSRHPKF